MSARGLPNVSRPRTYLNPKTMKFQNILFLFACLLLGTNAWSKEAAPVFSVTADETTPGYEWLLHINMENADNDNLTSFQLDLHLPADLTYVEGSAEASARLANHTLYANPQANGSLRLATLSLTSAAIAAYDGEICTLRVRSARGLEAGNYTLSMDGILCVARNGVNYVSDTTYGTLTSSGTSATPASYTLTYLVDGEVYTTASYAAGEAITPAEAPDKKGHTFEEWEGLPTTMPDNDLTVTAKYSVNAYTITYYLDNELYATQTVDYGAKITPPEVQNTETATFEGWQDVPETMPDHDLSIYGTMKSISTQITAPQRQEQPLRIYDLQGRRIQQATRGIFIINGRKVLRK